MDIKPIISLLEKEIGLSYKSIGTTIIERAIRGRMDSCNCKSIFDYVSTLSSEKNEIGNLIEAVVIPETSFFRDQAPFKALAEWITKEWMPNCSGEILRILSIPCSTGEEPYSIAMTLFDAGMTAEKFKIDAVDISERLLQVGRRGIYTDYSFRGTDLKYRERFFQREKDLYHLDEKVKSAVNFLQGNILDAQFVGSRQPYQVIFCRNLLIYFDINNKLKAFDGLTNILNNHGLLFVGHAETAHVPNDKYKKIIYPMAFGFHKTTEAINDRPKRETSFVEALRTIQTNKKTIAWISGKTTETKSPDVIHNTQLSDISLETSIQDNHLNAGLQEQNYPRGSSVELVRQLVSSGDLEYALEIAEQQSNHESDADLLFELGDIHLRLNDPILAEDCFRRVIYLNPDHYPALQRLAMLAEKRFDLEAAEKYLLRAKRVMKRTAGIKN